MSLNSGFLVKGIDLKVNLHHRREDVVMLGVSLLEMILNAVFKSLVLYFIE
jgi:hypothetical protein